jgi:predicted signal transduction protein with EAL and GGDEF domain
MWLGMLTYSIYRRSQTRLAVNAVKFLKTKMNKEKLTHPVTRLPNRAGFEHVVNNTSLLVEFSHWSALAVEISNMDMIRRVYGWDAGNVVEKKVAGCLKEIANDQEFVSHDDRPMFWIIVACESEDEVAFRVEQIVEKLTPFLAKGAEVSGEHIDIQFKYALFVKDHEREAVLSAENGSIVRRIVYALEHSRKNSTGDVVVFNEAMELALQRRLNIEVGLHKAISEKEIIPYFQPLIDLTTNQVLGFEVLARWDHPQMGRILPDEFIHLAERRGMLGGLTLSLLEQACNVAKNWPEDLVLAINVSPNDLNDDELAKKTLEILQHSGIAPSRLELEITENTLIEDIGNVGGVVRGLTEHGISFAIDDFGTGYSSLSHLRSLPFDKIKIDKAFVKDIATDAECRSIVQSVIALGKSLGMLITAEGIETGKSLKILQETTCNIGQGYLFARPLAENEVSQFLSYFERRNVNLFKVA